MVRIDRGHDLRCVRCVYFTAVLKLSIVVSSLSLHFVEREHGKEAQGRHARPMYIHRDRVSFNSRSSSSLFVFKTGRSGVK